MYKQGKVKKLGFKDLFKLPMCPNPAHIEPIEDFILRVRKDQERALKTKEVNYKVLEIVINV